MGDPEVLRHLPRLCEPRARSLLRVHEQGAREVLGLPLESLGQAGMEAYPEVVAGVQKPVPDGVGRHPPPPGRIEPPGDADAVDAEPITSEDVYRALRDSG